MPLNVRQKSVALHISGPAEALSSQSFIRLSKPSVSAFTSNFIRLSRHLVSALRSRRSGIWVNAAQTRPNSPSQLVTISFMSQHNFFYLSEHFASTQPRSCRTDAFGLSDATIPIPLLVSVSVPPMATI